jgi:hexosaminidase
MAMLFAFVMTLIAKGQIIPQPQHIELLKGKDVSFNNFKLNDKSVAEHPWLGRDPFFLIHETCEKVRNVEVVLIISPQKDKTATVSDEYTLVIDKKITISSATENGLKLGVSSLKQWFYLHYNHEGSLPKVKIIDAPKFNYRGVHLDVSRHFFPVQFIKTYLDILALYKINQFHWHLTDDQGWRIQIKKYPLLHAVGSWRNETMVAKNFQPYVGDSTPHAGYYGQDEIKEIVQYAADRGINVIPEIEMPGHARAALAAYPQYSCRQVQQHVPGVWGVFEDVYCVNDSTFNFLFDVLDEVIALFPSKMIHIGGDEVPKSRWKECPKCQHAKTSHNLKDEHELQSYFVGKIDSFLTSRGRTLVGWDEILEGGLSPNAVVMSWRGTEGGIAAAKQKHQAIMTPGSHCYFDHYQDTSKNEPLAIGGFTSLEKVYNYQPIPSTLDSAEQTYILGAQANLWTEYMPTEKQVLYMLLPRLCALSEVLWTDYKDFISFENRIDQHEKFIFERNFWNYKKYEPKNAH